MTGTVCGDFGDLPGEDWPLCVSDSCAGNVDIREFECAKVGERLQRVARILQRALCDRKIS